MTIHFEVSTSVADVLRTLGPDPSQSAKEAALVELYRRERLSHAQLGEALGFSRFETDALLKRHGVAEDLMTPAELAADVARLRRLIP